MAALPFERRSEEILPHEAIPRAQVLSYLKFRRIFKKLEKDLPRV